MSVKSEILKKYGVEKDAATKNAEIFKKYGITKDTPDNVVRPIDKSDAAKKSEPLGFGLAANSGYTEAKQRAAQAANRQAVSDFLQGRAYNDDIKKASLYDLTIGSAKRGYYNSLYGEELFDQMMGQDSRADELASRLEGDEFNFEAKSRLGQGVSGAAELLGQQFRQLTNPNTLALAGTAAGLAAIAGQAGPQIALPEEVITVPYAFRAGMKLGSAKSNLEIEAGHAYKELLDNGISEQTAKAIAIGVGTGNAALEAAQLDELFKSAKVLENAGASDSVLKMVFNELGRRGLDVGKETLQEVGQEGVTIAGTQLGSLIDKGELAYSGKDVANRLGETALSSALSFGLMNVPGGVHNVYAQKKANAKANTMDNMVETLKQAGASEADAEKLAPAMTALLNGEEISGNQAAAIATNEAAIKELQAQTGETINTDAPLGEVKKAVRELAARQSAQASESVTEDTPKAETEQAASESETGSIITRIGKTMGKAGETVMNGMYAEGQDATQYAESMVRAYNAGLNGEENAGNLQGITSIQAKAAYDAGKIDAGRSAEIADTAAVSYNKTKNETEALYNGEEVHLRDSGERTGSANPGGQVSAVAESTRRIESGQAEVRSADGGTAALSYGEKVTTASLGIGRGANNDGIRIVTGGDTEATAKARALAKERGLRLVLFSGDNLHIRQDDGSYASVRGYISGDRVFVRVDHPLYTSDQIMRHEAGHDMIAKGEINLDDVRNRIAENYDVEEAAQLYADAYAGTGMTADEIWAEVICDSLGDMNVFSETMVEEKAQEYLTETRKAAESVRSEGDSRALPADGKMSRNLDERRRALRKGEMVNAFRDKVNWKEFYQKILSDEYNQNYFDDGEISYINVGGEILKIEMQNNGEWSVIDIVGGTGNGNLGQGRRSDFEENGRRKFPEQRENDGDLGDERGRKPSYGKERGFGIVGQENNGQRNGESGATDDSVNGDKEADYSRELESVEKMREEYRKMLEEYGAIEPGEKPVRDIQVPQRTSKNEKVSQTVRTVMEAGATPEEMLPSIEEMVVDGSFSYETYGDKEAISDAETTIKNVGWAKALTDWEESLKKGEVSKANTAMGWALYNNAANSGDTQTALTVLDYMVKHQRSAAQALQATRILKKLSPETQLYQAQQSVNNLQEDLNKKYGDAKSPKLKIDEELAKRFMTARDQDARDAVMKEIYRDIGKQLPSTFMDKWNAWRYLAMLGNARTHGRNIIGNAMFAPVVTTKNVFATGIEAAVNRVSKGKLDRTKCFVGVKDKELLKAAWYDYDKVAETAMDGGKYSDMANANKYIEEGRRVFNFSPLEAVRRGNSKALEKEDEWFSKPHYAAAMASYCKANGITAEQIAKGGEAVNKARAYAIKEAQKATYRDTNAFSQMVSGWGRKGGKNSVEKGMSMVMEGILPFRKTPANILVRGLEYSPVGLMNGIKQTLWDVSRGNKTGAEAIDTLSAGLTGTGLLGLGIYLAAEGLVRGHGDKEEEKNKFMELMGHQAYALELPNGTSVTLDWLAPECLPFFVGVNLWEQTGKEKDKVTLSSILDSVSMVTEPFMEMSCLQSLNDVFDAVGYASDEGLDALPSALASSVTSYLTQGLPTLLGQGERSYEDVRMTTYTEKNAFLTGDMQYALGKASARIPGWDYQQIPYIDAWGRKEGSGAVGERSFNNFINPAYTSDIDESAMEKELLRLYETTGETKVFPDRAAKYFNVDNVRIDLTAEQYVKYATAKGQTAQKLMTALTKSSAYKAMSNADKVDAVSKVYEYANAVAKTKVSGYKLDGWAKKAYDVNKQTGVKIEQYIALYLAKNDINSLKDKYGNTIDNSAGLQIMEEVYKVKGMTDEQRQALFEAFGVGKKVRHYNKALVAEKLAQMRNQ